MQAAWWRTLYFVRSSAASGALISFLRSLDGAEKCACAYESSDTQVCSSAQSREHTSKDGLQYSRHQSSERTLRLFLLDLLTVLENFIAARPLARSTDAAGDAVFPLGQKQAAAQCGGSYSRVVLGASHSAAVCAAVRQARSRLSSSRLVPQHPH